MFRRGTRGAACLHRRSTLNPYPQHSHLPAHPQLRQGQRPASVWVRSSGLATDPEYSAKMSAPRFDTRQACRPARPKRRTHADDEDHDHDDDLAPRQAVCLWENIGGGAYEPALLCSRSAGLALAVRDCVGLRRSSDSQDRNALKHVGFRLRVCRGRTVRPAPLHRVDGSPPQ